MNIPSEDPTVSAPGPTPGAAPEAAQPTKPVRQSRGVRWEPDEEAWLEALAPQLVSGGAMRSFGAAARTAVALARGVLGVVTLEQLGAVKARLETHVVGRSMSLTEVVHVVFHAGLQVTMDGLAEKAAQQAAAPVAGQEAKSNG